MAENNQRLLGQLEDNAEAVHQMNAQNRARQYNYLTGEAYADNLTPEEYARIEQDNALAEKLGEYFGQEGASYTPQNVMAIAGKGWASLNERYGGATGIYRHYYNPQLVENIGKAYRDRQAKAQADAVAAAQAEADKDVTLNYGEGRQYTITKQNAEEIKKLAAIAGNTQAPANLRQQATQQLITALQAAGYNVEGLDASQITSAEDLFAKVSEGEGGLNRYMDLANILQEASRDRTPVVPKQKDVLTLLREREARQAEIDRATEQKRIERARLGQGFAGLAATIGDMVRASQGARVDPRDWQKMYDNLTAQERANVNNYQIRMAKIRDDAEKQALYEKQLAAQQAAKQAEREQEAALKGAELSAKAEQGRLNRESAERIAQAKLDAQKTGKSQTVKNRYDYYYNSHKQTIYLGDKAYIVDKNEYNSILDAIHGVITKTYKQPITISNVVNAGNPSGTIIMQDRAAQQRTATVDYLADPSTWSTEMYDAVAKKLQQAADNFITVTTAYGNSGTTPSEESNDNVVPNGNQR